jgi:transcriptional regulator with XRE-family HTH domain
MKVIVFGGYSMSSISYSYLDELMSKNDSVFFKQLGKRVANARKELGMTQIQLAEILGISQQHLASMEVGRRKVPASSIPVLVKLFGISSDALLGLEGKPAKRGPASTLQRQIEQVGMMPRTRQKFISEMLDALIKQQQAG